MSTSFSNRVILALLKTTQDPHSPPLKDVLVLRTEYICTSLKRKRLLPFIIEERWARLTFVENFWLVKWLVIKQIYWGFGAWHECAKNRYVKEQTTALKFGCVCPAVVIEATCCFRRQYEMSLHRWNCTNWMWTQRIAIHIRTN